MRYVIEEKTNFYDVNRYRYITKKLEKLLKRYKLIERIYLEYEKKLNRLQTKINYYLDEIDNELNKQ